LFPLIKIYKIGPHLFICCGQKIIKLIKERGGKVFLDLKFFDIPNTVGNACRGVVRLGIDMFSLQFKGD
jgi:orotidine-5'-phosphate decarboxylase